MLIVTLNMVQIDPMNQMSSGASHLVTVWLAAMQDMIARDLFMESRKLKLRGGADI